MIFSIKFVGLDGVFVGSGIFKSGNPAERARAIVQAVTHYKDAKLLAEVTTRRRNKASLLFFPCKAIT